MRIWAATALLFLSIATAACGAESFETAPVRPEGGDYVPPPFTPLAADGNVVACLGRTSDLAGAVPLPTVAGRPLLQGGSFILNGQPLAPPPLAWSLKTPAVIIAERKWTAGAVQVSLRQTIEYDGFITCDLTLAPGDGETAINDLTLRLDYRPDASTLYQIPATSATPAGLWPKEKSFENAVPGVWGGDDAGGLACYVATFRDWRSAGPRLTLKREGNGAGAIIFPVIAAKTPLKQPVTYRFGFIATPVVLPEPRHWQLYALLPGAFDVDRSLHRVLFWSGFSDRYATFKTNKPEDDAKKIATAKEAKKDGKSLLVYTTYAHVEEGAVQVPPVWGLMNAAGKLVAASIGGSMADKNRVFCCPGCREWIEWKMQDLKFALDRYGVDGFYVDTSYIIQACANGLHGHGWVDEKGERQTDFVTWSMREVWRRSYEMLCRARGKAEIYAHHKGGCPPALAAFTSAFCDGEQYCGQTIKNLTLDAFRAQISGRNMGPLALFLCEYYRSMHYKTHEKSQHHNPTESAMLPLLHDVLPTGYPGDHPVRELLMLRDDLGIADATWIPYYAPDSPWRAEGTYVAQPPPAVPLPICAYRTARGDSLLVAGNPNYEKARVRIVGPEDATAGRAFVAIDVLSRLGRGSHATPGYRWEEAKPDRIEIAPRSFALFACVRQPETLPAFARQRGFAGSQAAHARRTPVPSGATLLDDFEDPDWTFANDDGELGTTDRDSVDTIRALRVSPKPKHDSAALLRTFAEPQDWTAYAAISFWLRPEREFPLRALQLRLRDTQRYGPPMKLASHDLSAVLPAGKWTQLRYDFGPAPRKLVEILRIYYNRGNLVSGPFDIDEMFLCTGTSPGR